MSERRTHSYDLKPCNLPISVRNTRSQDAVCEKVLGERFMDWLRFEDWRQSLKSEKSVTIKEKKKSWSITDQLVYNAQKEQTNADCRAETPKVVHRHCFSTVMWKMYQNKKKKLHDSVISHYWTAIYVNVLYMEHAVAFVSELNARYLAI